MKRKGFTLIELLIVITLLGILAVAVLSAINPIEQINRSKDTARQGDCEQLINAFERYYATNGYYPWMSASGDTAALTWTAIGDTAAAGISNISGGGTGEVKESFVTRILALDPPLQAYNRGTQGDSTYVCFKPSSAAFREKAWKRCTEDSEYGDLPTDYPDDACPEANCTAEGVDAGSATGCYYCLP